MPMLALAADCVPVALARTNGDAPGAGGRSTSAGAACSTGIVETRPRRSAAGARRAVVGPAIGPCCYEVGEDVAEHVPGPVRRGDRQRRQARPLDGGRAGAARTAGAKDVERVDLCTPCHPELFFSHRRDRQAARDAGCDRRLSAEAVRARYERVREEVGPAVTIVAATKYVSVEDMAVLAEAGVEVVGENRAQDLEAKHAAYGDAFRWHFIGHLQSRKAKVVNGICELVHSLDSESAAQRLEIPALVQVNLAGEETKSGVAPEALPRFLELLPGRPRPVDDAAARGGSRGVAPVLPQTA